MYPHSFLSVYAFLTYLRCITALSLSTISNLSAGQTVTVNWARSKNDPDTFFVSLRKDNGDPLPPTRVDSDGESTGQVAIDIPLDVPEGNYLFEGFNTGGPLTQSTPSLAGSNSFKLVAAALSSTAEVASSSVEFTSSSVASISFTIIHSSVIPTSLNILPTPPTVAVNPPLKSTTSLPSASSSSVGSALPFSTTSSTATESVTAIAPTIQATTSASPKLTIPIIITIAFASLLGLVVLLLCLLVVLRCYHRQGSRSMFFRDRMIRQRAYTPSFSNSPVPILGFDAPPQSEAPEEPAEKFPPPDYAWTSTQQTGTPLQKTTISSLVIPPTLPELPPLPSPVVVALPNIVTFPSSTVKDQVSLNSFPLPPSTVPVAGKFQVARLGAPETDKTRNSVSRQRRSTKVSNDILALKIKMLQLKQQGLEDSEVFSEAREKVPEVGEEKDSQI